MKLKRLLAALLSLVLLTSLLSAGIAADAAQSDSKVKGVFSTSSGSNFLVPFPDMDLVEDTGELAEVNITVDPTRTFQEYDGLGMSLEDSSIQNLWALGEDLWKATLKTVVEDYGIDVFRLTIGSSDCVRSLPFWSFDELPAGVEEDWDLKYFSIQSDINTHVTEIVQYIKSLNPNAKFFASAWSAPAWMKEIRRFDHDNYDRGYNAFLRNTDGSYKVLLESDVIEGGADKPYRRFQGWSERLTYRMPHGGLNTRTEQMNYLRDDCIDVFAEYYLKYVLAYKALGIDIYALTILNEPGADVIYPGMNLTIDQHQLLGKAIKQKFRANGLDTQLWAHDWNINDVYHRKSMSGYPTIYDETEDNHHKMFEDSAVATREEMLDVYDAIALHVYEGAPSRIGEDVVPFVGDMKIHQTEGNQQHATTNLLSWFMNGASTFTFWVPFVDQNGGIVHWTPEKVDNFWNIPPATGWGGLAVCRLTDPVPNVTWTYNFRTWRHFTNFLVAGSDRPGDEGSVRIYSTPGTSNEMQNNVKSVAFKNPDGEIVVVVYNNTSNAPRTVKISMQGKCFTQTIPARGTATFHWMPEAVVQLSTNCENLVAGYRANVVANVVADNADGLLFALFDGETKVSESVPIGNGRVLLNTLIAQDTGSTLQAAVYREGGTPIALVPITIWHPDPEALWAPLVTLQDGAVKIAFPETVSLAAGAKASINGGAGLPLTLDADKKSLSIAATCEAGDKIVVSGVKYPILFPSYKFTFSLEYKG